ncbi:hypothetical protein P171DRAFT_444164 [Karstenula rhodostoma CBS 690.94]|uniref:Uncharacterized protein n=1 Tax=Karstenula rhodostoma CBS 690.94 TaxID=1392251 RepID=A0A9P4PJR5_9PLEO|nr:hypothetical protein P171DRAFT_444164 [Karstenula rhodostoma CBS 690.94]
MHYTGQTTRPKSATSTESYQSTAAQPHQSTHPATDQGPHPNSAATVPASTHLPHTSLWKKLKRAWSTSLLGQALSPHSHSYLPTGIPCPPPWKSVKKGGYGECPPTCACRRAEEREPGIESRAAVGGGGAWRRMRVPDRGDREGEGVGEEVWGRGRGKWLVGLSEEGTCRGDAGESLGGHC